MVGNNKIYGWAGKVLRVDLSTGTCSSEPINRYLEFIGGRGIQQWIIFNEASPDIHPLDPENIIIFGTGPLTGTQAPASNFMCISSKNVFNGGANFSHVGGFFAPELKFAGYDQIVITGKAKKPVYLWITNERVEFRDASHLWGKTISQTEQTIRQTHSDDLIRVACIGPAGENLVRFAAIMVDRTRAAAGGGIGAVMGSKNLKAVAVRGTDPVKIADPDSFDEAVAASLKKINESGNVGIPTHIVTRPMNDVCLIPFRNTEDDHWDEQRIEKIDLAAIKTYKSTETQEACFNCPLGACRRNPTQPTVLW